MNNDKPRRNPHGKFVKGFSGNPCGKTKDGLVPEQDHPVQDAKDVSEFIQDARAFREFEEHQRSETKRILLEKAPDLMRKACEMAMKDPRVMKEILPCLATNIHQNQRDNGAKKAIPRREQLEMEFVEQMKADGRDVEELFNKTDKKNEESE